MNLIEKKRYFLEIFKRAERRFGKDTKRLASEGWKEDWQTLIVTILSAQSRDETTIPIAEELFIRYPTLDVLAQAKYIEVANVLRSMNYYKTKAKHGIACAQMLIADYAGEVPDNIEEMIRLPGVGRKTANLVLSEIHGKEGICVDTHVHRISNVLGLVQTKTPTQTEYAMQKIAPKKYWSRINRIFVLWGKTVAGKDKKKLLSVLT